MGQENLEQAKKIYDTMVSALHARDWSFEEDEDNLAIISGYQGEDIPIRFYIVVDPKKEVIRFMSPMPFKVVEDKRVDVALAVCVANYGMVNGSFDYDLNTGSIFFRLTTSYCGCEIGEGFFMDMISTAVLTTDRYNDKFMMMSKDMMSLSEFIAQEDN